MSKIGRLLRVAKNYTVGRRGDNPSTADFWYRQAPPRVIDAASLDTYRSDSDPWPHYLFDHRNKLSYPTRDGDGLILLNYDDPVGTQTNPEAVAQDLLGLADEARASGDPLRRDEFIRKSTILRDRQTTDGDFTYPFDWGDNRAPWNSALAQTRCASVLLRAWQGTGDESFRAGALQAVSRFDVPVADGGYLHQFQPPGSNDTVPYYEEYPQSPSTVINGFMAALMGLWELAEWTDDPKTKALLETGRESLDIMLPHFSTPWWSLYDLHGTDRLPNVQSVFYHVMVTNYLQVLATIMPSPVIHQTLAHYKQVDTPINRYRATWGKVKFKVMVR